MDNRTAIAIAVVQGIYAAWDMSDKNPFTANPPDIRIAAQKEIALVAVAQADALLDELERTSPMEGI